MINSCDNIKYLVTCRLSPSTLTESALKKFAAFARTRRRVGRRAGVNLESTGRDADVNRRLISPRTNENPAARWYKYRGNNYARVITASLQRQNGDPTQARILYFQPVLFSSLEFIEMNFILSIDSALINRRTRTRRA